MLLSMRVKCWGLILGHVGAILWLSWEDSGVTWGILVAMLRNVGLYCGYLWRTWGLLWSTLGFVNLAKWKMLILHVFYMCF